MYFNQIKILHIVLIYCFISNVLSLAEEKLQVMTTKKIDNCSRRSKVGDTLYMQYTVNTFYYFLF